MRVLVYGGRKFKDTALLFKVLDEYHALYSFSVVIEGEAPGADRLAALWAARRRVPIDPYPAEWNRLGLAAGPIRNSAMLAQGRPELGIAFPGGTGTADMTAKLIKANVKVIEVDRDGTTKVAQKTTPGP
jgi:hypothetical protein